MKLALVYLSIIATLAIYIMATYILLTSNSIMLIGLGTTSVLFSMSVLVSIIFNFIKDRL
jgi:hypothetical protein